MPDGSFQFRRLRRHFKNPLQTGSGTVSYVDRLLLRVESPEGLGWGEIAPWPTFPVEKFAEDLDLLEAAKGNLTALYAGIAGREEQLPCLMAALAMARDWSVIQSTAASLPCTGLIPIGASTERLKSLYEAGYRSIKIKISPETNLVAFETKITTLPSDLTLRLDANGSLPPERARDWIHFTQDTPQIEFLEQPLAAGHPELLQHSGSKIALDESITQPVGNLAAESWPGLFILKPALCGDWEPVAAWAKARPGRVVLSSAFETAIGRQAGLVWAAALNLNRAVGFDTLNYFEPDGWEMHNSGPVVKTLDGFDWEAYWRKNL